MKEDVEHLKLMVGYLNPFDTRSQSLIEDICDALKKITDILDQLVDEVAEI